MFVKYTTPLYSHCIIVLRRKVLFNFHFSIIEGSINAIVISSLVVLESFNMAVLYG